MNFANKLYIVTGAAVDSDIGLAICQSLDEKGARLILVGRRAEALETTLSLLKNKHHKIRLLHGPNYLSMIMVLSMV